MSCHFDPLGAVQNDDHPHAALAVRTLASCSTSVGRLTAATLSAATIVAAPFDMTGLSNAQVVATVTAQHSTRQGNVVQFAVDLQVNMAVDFTAYPVPIGTIPAGVAPKTAVMATFPTVNPPNPASGAMVVSITPAGVVSIEPTGFPFPAGVYTLSYGKLYLV